MTDDGKDTLNNEQLNRLAQYFEEAVVSAEDYKPPRGEVSHLA
jgi:hypothetical protein